jgi:hypothetical protein
MNVRELADGAVPPVMVVSVFPPLVFTVSVPDE